MVFFAGFFKALLGICETPLLDAELWALEENQVTMRLAEAAALGPVGGAVRLEGKGLASSILIVHADADEYLAFENRCTHSGRRLDPVEGKGELRCCSIGHARFDYQGGKLSGPAKGPLKKYPVEKQGEELVVTLDGGSGPAPD
jgi:nitrite reductase/ring-hydroxylating ferredoxin subunit